MLIPFYMPITGLLAAFFLKDKKVRVLAVYGAGFILALLLEAVRGYTSLWMELILIFFHTVNYSLGYRIARGIMAVREGRAKEKGKKRLVLLILFLGLFLAVLNPYRTGNIKYKVKEDHVTYTISYKNAGRIWKYLRRNLGCTRAAAAGVLGNMFAESEYRPEAIQTNEVGHGIGQWSWDRWYGEDGLQAYAEKHGKNWDDMGLQLSFFRHEVVENDSMDVYYDGGFSRYRKLRQVEGEEGTAHVFFFSFEYGAYMSYEAFLSDEFNVNYATRSKRLSIAKRIYADKIRFP